MNTQLSGSCTRLMLACLLPGMAYAAPPPPAQSKASTNPILFVTQFPIPSDFATIGSVFANHEAELQTVGRGGDLYLRYPDGSLCNLTRQAGYGLADGFQGANAIAVRDPAVHWSGTKAVFAMVIGAPTQQYQVQSYRWQLFEVSGFGACASTSIVQVPNQPTAYNNVQPAYASDGTLIFVSDRPRGGEPHLYPQHDEYESTATPTGLWKLDPANGALTLLQHAPSGSFTPIVDSFGRVVFTRWDHLQRDQQADADTADIANGQTPDYGTFDYANESAGASKTNTRIEIFPEPRIRVGNSTTEGHTINHFFPWQLNQDGTEEETLNHIGRHELHSYFNRSFNDDGNLDEFISVNSGRVNPNSILNLLQIREDPAQAGRYVAIDAPEFNTHASGQLVRFLAPPTLNPALMSIEYLTPRSTFGTAAQADHTGHYRNPLPLANGDLIAAHTSHTGGTTNSGTRSNPQTPYQFRLKRLAPGVGGFMAPVENLTAGITRNVSFWDPDVLVSYNGPMWELSPVEVRATPVPPDTGFTQRPPEQQAFTLENVDPNLFREYLEDNGLAVVVMRNVTSRDALDEQQPYNLRVLGGETTNGSGGKIYDIAHMQFFQGDQTRGIGGIASPAAGRRVIAALMHDAQVAHANAPNAGGPAASVPIASDGSVAAFVPTRRAMAWQTTAADGTPVVRERYWITFQPGEIRACDGCHGVNQTNQAGEVAAQNVSVAFRDLLARWKTIGPLFGNGFE